MRVFSVIFVVGFVLSSCKTGYIPNSVNTPMLSQKGEFQASALYSTSTLNLQTAYAVTDKIGLMINGNYHFREWRDEFDPSFLDYYERSVFGEIGGGYTFARSDKFQFDLYGGIGGGRVQSIYPDDTEFSFDGYNIRGFVQPSFGLVNKIVEITFTPRFSYVQVHNTNIGLGGEVYRDIFIEPHFVAKVGYKSVKFVTQVGIVLPTLFPDASVGANPFNLGIGIQYILGGRRWEE